MKLTPLDIKKQEFKKSMRGYDPVEVDAFLEMVSDELESLIRQNKELTDEALKLKTQLRDYQDVEKTLQETLMSAQESINSSKENSKRQAEMIIREAELKAEKMLEETKLRLAEMKNELLIIKAQKDSFARRLRHLLQSQIELIEVLELDDLGFEKAEKRPRKPQPEPRPAQERIEFKGVEEILPEEQAVKQVPEKAEGAGQATPRDWPQKPGSSADEESAETEEERRARISDQLII
ncbi:MAG: DivIVA domain-containing protein [Calditrichaeota bacterium]|nr:MAG: DivIVA domain-containing protein [Calditrichota bacterium]